MFMALLSQEGTRLVWLNDYEKLWIEPWGKDSLRVRATCQAEMPEEDWALIAPAARDARIVIDGQRASITNGKIRAEIADGGSIRFFNQKDEKLLEEQWRTRDSGDFAIVSALEVKARDFVPITGGDYALNMRFEPNPGEKIFGMGQYQDGCLDKMGCVLELAHRNSQASVPFYVSTVGYGFLWNNPAVGRASFGRNMTEWQARSTKALDYWNCAGDAPADILHAYADATGHSP
ncbi:MAG: hypothetical protein FWF95_08390, partial [Syntrophorhabdaceae bacterium]|nr:hypothetical protein [Syntrophorhabdaceae bacterium]